MFSNRIALVACVAQKQAHPAPAADLYISPLFKLARAYVETWYPAWRIISAKHGMLLPDTVIGPYELTLNNMEAVDRKLWAWRIIEELEYLQPEGIDFYAGSKYREHLVPWCERNGIPYSTPLKGLRIGEQLAWFKNNMETNPCHTP